MPRNFRDRPISDTEVDVWFCLRCEGMQERDTIVGMYEHFKISHQEPAPVRRVDYASGSDIRRRITDEDAAADRFGLFVESLFGVEDFLTECRV